MLQAKIKRQQTEERKNIVNMSLKEMMQSTIFKDENIHNIDKNFSNNDTSIHTTSPATAALEAAKTFYDSSRQQGSGMSKQNNSDKKRKNISDDSTNVPNGRREVDKNGSKTYYEEELGLHLPDQNSGKKRARRRGPRSMTSGYRGVTCYRRTGRWEAHIWENRRQIHLGSFSNPCDAARSYDRAALRFRGIDADLNFDIKDYRDDPVLRSGAHLTNEDFVKLLRAHDKITSASKPLKSGESSENKNDDQANTRDPEYEKRLRCYIVKHVATNHYQNKAGLQKVKSRKTTDGHAQMNMQGGGVQNAKYATNDAFAMNHTHPSFHQNVQFQYANASAMDHNAVVFNHIQTHPNEAVTMPVPMMQVWNVGQMDEVNNSNIEFLAISGDVNDPHSFNGPRSSDINPEMVFNLVDPHGVPIHTNSQNNSPQSHSIRSDMIQHELGSNGTDYGKVNGHQNQIMPLS